MTRRAGARIFALFALSLVAALALPWVAEAGSARLAAAAAAPPEPSELGPWTVGHRTLTATDATRDGRTLTIDVWYPADPAPGAPPAFYRLIGIAGVPSEVALDSIPVAASETFPLVAFSHGNAGARFQSFFLCEVLASHGFVVAAPDHAGNTAFDVLLGTSVPLLEAALDRPQDISFVIDTLLARSATPGDPFEAHVDPLRIGVSGHSFGGFTSLAMVSGFGPIPPDPRVLAIAPIAPASGILTDAKLASIDVPTLILGGTSDITTPVEPESRRPQKLLSANPRYRVDLRSAGHASFTNICTIADLLEAIGIDPVILTFLDELIQEGCAPELMPIDEAHALTNLYVVAFLARFVAMDERYARFLTPELVAERALPVDFYAVEGRERVHP